MSSASWLAPASSPRTSSTSRSPTCTTTTRAGSSSSPTRGHQSLLVRLNDDKAIILVADAAYLPRNIELSVLPAIVWSPEAMVASWHRIRELQRVHDAELIFTHDLEW